MGDFFVDISIGIKTLIEMKSLYCIKFFSDEKLGLNSSLSLFDHHFLNKTIGSIGIEKKIVS